MLDPYQFGDSKAAINLAEILSRPENLKFNRQVTLLLQKYNHLLNQLDTEGTGIDEPSRSKILTLIRDDFKRCIVKRNFPPVVESHTSNVFMKNFREAYNKVKDRNDFLRKRIKTP